jgi:hypothetical protein
MSICVVSLGSGGRGEYIGWGFWIAGMGWRLNLVSIEQLRKGGGWSLIV